MSRRIKRHRLKDLVIEELSLVDRPANQGSYLLLQKVDARPALGFYEALAAVAKRRGLPPTLASPHGPTGASTPIRATTAAAPKRPASTVRVDVQSPRHSEPALVTKADAERALNDYADRWRLPGETTGQVLLRLSAQRDDELSKLYDRYRLASG